MTTASSRAFGTAARQLTSPCGSRTAGLYRLWIQYQAKKGVRGLMGLSIYRAGREGLGPAFQPDDIYDRDGVADGPAWKDLLLDFEAGDYVVRISHATAWWHGGNGYADRKVNCLYLTTQLWAGPPSAETMAAMRQAAAPQGVQWTATATLAPEELEAWRWWQIRPLAWEDAAGNPKLFALSREFQREIVGELARKDYQEDKDKLPDYRAPERQVVFDETWNLVANPARARKQIQTLQDDVQSGPLGYNYVWHDIASHIPGLTDAQKPAAYGAWYRDDSGWLMAGYGAGSGTVSTEVPVPVPGKYAVWVQSSDLCRSYTAPWIAKGSVDGVQQFKYEQLGKIPSSWMKMGDATLKAPGKLRVDFTLDGTGGGGTYRYISTLFLTDKPGMAPPQGTIRPPWTVEMYRQRAREAGVGPGAKYLLWVPANAFTPLSQEVWADQTTGGKSWPDSPVSGDAAPTSLLMAAGASRATQVCLRNLTAEPITLEVQPGPFTDGKNSYPDAVSWRVVAFAPYGPDRQQWSPFFLLRRPTVTIPPFNTAAVWLTFDTRKVVPGEYSCQVRFGAPGAPERQVEIKARVSAVRPNPRQPTLVGGYTQPHEGEAFMRDFVEHGMKVWWGEMSKADMEKWGIRLLMTQCWDPSPKLIAETLARLKGKGLDFDDWVVKISDEPNGKTETELAPVNQHSEGHPRCRPKGAHPVQPRRGSAAGNLPDFETVLRFLDALQPAPRARLWRGAKGRHLQGQTLDAVHHALLWRQEPRIAERHIPPDPASAGPDRTVCRHPILRSHVSLPGRVGHGL